MVLGFQLAKTVDGTTDKLQRKQLAPSLQFRRNGLLKGLANGKLSPLTAQADQAQFLMQSPDVLTTATDVQWANVIELTRSHILWTPMTALLSGVLIQAGSTSTSLIVPMTAGSTNDLIGATVYHRRTGNQRIVTANTYSGGNVTLTIVEPLGAPDPKFRPVYANTGDPFTLAGYTAVTPLVADLVDLVPYGVGTSALKYGSSNFDTTLSNAVADTTGGTVRVEEVIFVAPPGPIVKVRPISL